LNTHTHTHTHTHHHHHHHQQQQQQQQQKHEAKHFTNYVTSAKNDDITTILRQSSHLYLCQRENGGLTDDSQSHSDDVEHREDQERSSAREAPKIALRDVTVAHLVTDDRHDGRHEPQQGQGHGQHARADPVAQRSEKDEELICAEGQNAVTKEKKIKRVKYILCWFDVVVVIVIGIIIIIIIIIIVVVVVVVVLVVQ
jgi:hypothetical protein